MIETNNLQNNFISPKSNFLDIITTCINTRNKFLDLSKRNLTNLTEEIYESNHIEYLYLSDNDLLDLPVNFFSCFSKIKLLDLRFNKLTVISSHIQHLVCLEILLLDGNCISSLPNELGLLTKLRGLNIGSNPIEYPEKRVISKGVKFILKFLRDAHFNRNSDEFNIDDDADKCSGVASDHNLSDNWNVHNKYLESNKLYKPKLYQDIHQNYLDKQRKSSLYKRRPMNQTDKHNRFVQLFPEPVAIETIEHKMIDQMRMNKIKEVKQQQNSILQKIRDKNVMIDWREEAREIQYSKSMDQSSKLPLEIKLESDSRILGAPYKVEKQNLETISAEELSQQKERNLPKPPKPQPLDREIQLMMEADKRAREKTIQTRIRQHVDEMKIKSNKPKGTAQEELESAKRDLEIIVNLQKELQSNLSVI